MASPGSRTVVLLALLVIYNDYFVCARIAGFFCSGENDVDPPHTFKRSVRSLPLFLVAHESCVLAANTPRSNTPRMQDSVQLLPRVPCRDRECGVLMCVHTSGRLAKDRAIVREAVLSARVLRKFSQPHYPMALIATEDAHAMLSTSEAALWEVHRTLRLSGSILAMRAAARGLERKWSRRWERAARLSFVHKLQALLDTPFARTLFVDCDLYVLDGTPSPGFTLHVHRRPTGLLT